MPKGQRGRKKGQEVKINYSIIEDELIHPYKIYVDSSCYSVVEENEGEGTQEKNHGFYTNLANALNKIVKMKLSSNKKYSLSSFIKEYDVMLKEFTTKITV